MRLRLLGHQVLLSGALALACSLATAQTDEERAGARALAEQGAAAFDEGRWQDAVDLFTRAQSVVDAPPHLLFIARAQEKQGNLVQAMEAYIKIARTELAADSPDAFLSAQTAAEQELEALTPRIPQVTVTVSGESAEDVTVFADGEALAEAFVGVKRPANPGKHTYSAEGTTVAAPAVTISVSEGGEALVELVLAEKVAALEPAPMEPAPAPAAPPKAEPAAVGHDSSMNIPAYAALGVGALGLGAGGYFLYKRSKSQTDGDDLASECSSRQCDQSDVDRIVGFDEDAASAGTMSAIGFGVGAVGVGVGITLLLMDWGNETAQTEPTIGVWANSEQVGVVGRF